jgi:cation diffusion facilitator family transporter
MQISNLSEYMTTKTDLNFSLKKNAAWLSLLVGLLMFISKISAYLLTGSTAIFSDAAESVVHVAATSIALYSIYLSAKPADADHLYGHGNIEYFSAGLEGLLIIIAAVTIIFSSVNDLIFGVETSSLDTGTIIIAFASFINLWLGFYLIKKGKTTNSLILIADGKHVLTDSFTSFGVVFGLILVLITDIKIIDPIVAIFVAANILFTGYKLIRESIGGLMHETDKEMLNLIVSKLNSIKKEYWIDIHHLRFWKSGDRVFIDFHLILPHYLTVKESHLEEEYIETNLKDIIKECSIRIHSDYCKDEVCKFCGYMDCKVRKEERKINFDWNQERMLGDPIYKTIKIN